ncbi:DNA-binding MarR family transcriptional regulator [Mycolicibacterium sp. BK556]|uniref:MarR family winged helix-turn-helix transcriptional regulator n=1 Tax=Mycobacteriaceae TaxID=1762 RepID=UPI00105EBB4B|nr:MULTISPECIES: MarR family winged helix-turn-helix transcriptional regulator [Mycobacteriaceae]MBB3605007.1 DNA-binding MarR family transcriptional regulator [Mycolicibacterium sp. BK556]MBB3635203.1 DNA-binding MarR family transcriptional regulator [Mycolicibacterium sp. BK607]MBB3748003.1 DNA-binding MarR family transcriptional regulator [Mycolicibacterium sp. BK634]TDO07862.1 DNA-binding MarR family transcriptional regulator [Mycobacterium sp. BK086]
MDNAGRAELESAVVADIQALSAESDQIGREFAGIHRLSANDFRALVHVMVAENAGTPLTAGELRARMGLSGAAITYLVERMIESGHLRRDSDPTDRRKVILRYADHGIEVGRAFFTPLATHTHRVLGELPDADLAAAHRVFAAVLTAMTAFRNDLGS